MAILDPDKPYTYRNYFDLQIDPIDLAEYFEYSLEAKVVQLSQWTGKLDRVPQLTEDLAKNLTRMISRNEQTKREMLVAPIVQQIIANTLPEDTETLLRILIDCLEK